MFLGGDINAQLAIFHRGQNVNNVPFDSCGLWPSYYGHLGFPSRIQWRMSSLVQTRAHLVYQLMFYERFQILHVFETPSNNKSLNYKCYIAKNSNELFFFSRTHYFAPLSRHEAPRRCPRRGIFAEIFSFNLNTTHIKGYYKLQWLRRGAIKKKEKVGHCP